MGDGTPVRVKGGNKFPEHRLLGSSFLPGSLQFCAQLPDFLFCLLVAVGITIHILHLLTNGLDGIFKVAHAGTADVIERPLDEGCFVGHNLLFFSGLLQLLVVAVNECVRLLLFLLHLIQLGSETADVFSRTLIGLATLLGNLQVFTGNLQCFLELLDGCRADVLGRLTKEAHLSTQLLCALAGTGNACLHFIEGPHGGDALQFLLHLLKATHEIAHLLGTLRLRVNHLLQGLLGITDILSRSIAEVVERLDGLHHLVFIHLQLCLSGIDLLAHGLVVAGVLLFVDSVAKRHEILNPFLQVFHLVLRILCIQTDDAAVYLVFCHNEKVVTLHFYAKLPLIAIS